MRRLFLSRPAFLLYAAACAVIPDGSERLDTVEVSPSDGRVLALFEDEPVTARLYVGEVVDVTTVSGTVVRSLEVGVRGAVERALFALIGIGGVIVCGGRGRARGVGAGAQADAPARCRAR